MRDLHSYPTRQLSEFIAGLRFADVPTGVAEKAKELFLDWFASALAGKDSRPVRAFEAFAKQMGPSIHPEPSEAKSGRPTLRRERGPPIANRHQPLVRRASQWCRLARRRAR